jgi:hypothetical protein
MNLTVVINVAMVMLLKDFGPYGIIFMNVNVVITAAMAMLLKDFGPYGIIFVNVSVVIPPAGVSALSWWWGLRAPMISRAMPAAA